MGDIMNSPIATAKAISHRNMTKSAQLLLGICSGLVADGTINDREVIFLSHWLKENSDVTATWPGNMIAQRIQAILSDGLITDDEKTSLLELLEHLSGNDYLNTGSCEPASPAVPFDLDAEILFPERTFCLTGNFFYGTRAACEKVLAKLAAIPVASVTQTLDYLVVGGGCSPDWANATYGRKIETALARKQRYGTPAIVPEAAWVSALQRVEQ